MENHMSDRVYGKKYDAKITSKEVAVRIRQDIKTAIVAGRLPKGLKVSVRYEHYSGGSSIDLKVTAWPEGFSWLSPEWCIANTEHQDQYQDMPRYTDEAKVVMETLKGIHEAYNHDGSDIMTDYHDVKYHGMVSVDWELEKPECQRIYAMWKTPASQSTLKNLSLGDEVTFTRGPLTGVRLVIIDLDHRGPANVNDGLSVEMNRLSGGEVIYADGYDLNGLKIVKAIPRGMRVVRFKR
jgi:hypothetical protein